MEYDDIISLCKTNKTFNSWCKENKNYIFREMIKRYQIDYADEANLFTLDCSHNELTKIPIMPKLRTLDCRNNRLIELPIMPNLEHLYCQNNQLTTLPVLPKLYKLLCEGNLFTEIPKMPQLKMKSCDE